MADDFGDKTEAPTSRRLQESREEGNVVRSVDLTTGVILVGSVLLLSLFGTQLLFQMKHILATMLHSSISDEPTSPADVGHLVVTTLARGGQMIAPIAIGIVGLTLTIGMLQSGFLLTGKPLMPQLSRLSPFKGLQQIFSLRGAVKLLMSLLKVGAVITAAAMYISDDLPRMLSLVRLSAEPLLAASADMIWWLALKVAILLLVLGIIDYAYQKWQFVSDLKMTKQEIKEEYKRMEGDPLIKQRRAKIARQLMLQRLKRDVPKAQVVISNPTHFAIALQYESGEMEAPKVVAKGADFLALRIRQLAMEHGIPIVQRPPLARALYKNVEVGQQIPAEHYSAVAEILAYVYRLSGRKSA
jgi:flagellar biosynthetic protein FlhB